MTNATKDLCLRSLNSLLGDDLWRAKRAFAGKTKKEMDEKYGQSDQTCREIVAGYEAHDAAVRAAIAEVMDL